MPMIAMTETTKYVVKVTKLTHSIRVMVAGAVSGRARQSIALTSAAQLANVRTERTHARVVARSQAPQSAAATQ